MRRLALCTLLAVAVPLLAASSGREATGPFGPHVDSHGSWEVVTGDGWSAAKKIRANGYRSQISSEPQYWLWASTCTQGAQTLHAVRTVQLPGPPRLGRLEYALAAQPWMAQRGVPWKSFQVIVNGRSLVRLFGLQRDANGIKPLTADDRAAFRTGANKLEIVASRAPLPGKVTRCNSSADDLVGVAVGIRGESFADMALVAPATPRYYYKFEGSHAFKLTFTVTNKGPSAALDGRFIVGTNPDLVNYPQGSEDLLLLIDPGSIKAPAPFGECTRVDSVTGGNPNNYYLECPFAVFPPGTVTVDLTVYVRVPDAAKTSWYGSSALYLLWSVDTATTDPNNSNDDFQTTYVLCGKDDTRTECTKVWGAKS